MISSQTEPAVAVLEVVHLVEDDAAQLGEARRVGVDHVAQHLGRHDDDLGVAVAGHVAREQSDPGRPYSAAKSAYFWLERAFSGVV